MSSSSFDNKDLKNELIEGFMSYKKDQDSEFLNIFSNENKCTYR